MTLHAIDIHKNDSIVIILSPDTDVFVLALRHFPSIGSESCVHLGTGQKQQLVSLKLIYDIIGSDMAAALPGFQFHWMRHDRALCWKRETDQLEHPSKSRTPCCEGL